MYPIFSFSIIDAVIFHDYYFNNMMKKPAKRSSHQRYIYWNLERQLTLGILTCGTKDSSTGQ